MLHDLSWMNYIKTRALISSMYVLLDLVKNQYYIGMLVCTLKNCPTSEEPSYSLAFMDIEEVVDFSLDTKIGYCFL